MLASSHEIERRGKLRDAVQPGPRDIAQRMEEPALDDLDDESGKNLGLVRKTPPSSSTEAQQTRNVKVASTQPAETMLLGEAIVSSREIGAVACPKLGFPSN